MLPHQAHDRDLDRYASILEEARKIKGVSLGKDAWRRLRRNRVAMVSLAILILVSAAAFLTPLLPLAPPDAHHTALQYEAPYFRPLIVREELGLQLDQDEIDAIEVKLINAEKVLSASKQELAEVRTQRPNEDDEDETAQVAYEEQLDGAIERVRNASAVVRDVIHKPYRDAGYPDLGPLGRWMVRTRYQLFGDVALAPIGGRDELGRDVFSRLFWGARISLIVGIVATLVSLVIGVTYGAVSGYLGGWVDDVMMRIVDVMYSIPFIFVVIFLLSALDHDAIQDTLEYWRIDRITVFFFVVGAIYWLTMARVVRGQVISLKNDQFIEAARTIGSGRWRIIGLHLVPNILSVVIVYLTLTIPRVILFEAFLSFLGLGVEAPQVSWGMLANEGIKVITPIKIYWWLVLFPSLALGITLFALNFLGDGLRDALDPRMKNR